MITYAMYAKQNPCGSIRGYYLVDPFYKKGWVRQSHLTTAMGMSINEACAFLHNDHRYNGYRHCGCQFEIVELKDGIPNHLA